MTIEVEVEVDEQLVRALIIEQHPDLAALPVRPLSKGWDNTMFRLGEELTVRMPHREIGVELLLSERRWLPVLAPELPVAVPVPERAGAPGAGYPWPWSICRWVLGVPALSAALHPVDLADDVGAFLAAMHRPAPDDAPHNPYRGVRLAARDELLHRSLAVVDGIDTDAVRGAWAEVVDLRADDVAVPRWLHGDMHPANLLVDGRGRLSGVIDFGDVCAGDVASDLAVAWMLFPDDPVARDRMRIAAGVGADTWARGRGWAIALGLAISAGSTAHPAMEAMGRRTLAAALADRP
jgi:aminoglycoside phosphotransferase (APT) family kinase protein